MASKETVKEVQDVREAQKQLAERVQALLDKRRLSALDVGVVLSRMEHVIDDLDNLIDELTK
jgi:hypothetical protein